MVNFIHIRVMYTICFKIFTNSDNYYFFKLPMCTTLLEKLYSQF